MVEREGRVVQRVSCRAIVGLLWILGSAASAQQTVGVPPSAPSEEPEEEGLRQRLTEREDRRRPAEPWSIPVAGRPLTVGGEYELNPGMVWHGLDVELGDDSESFLLEQDLELEVFYSFAPWLSLFAQARLAMEMFDRETELFAERGELWLYSEDIAGTGVNLDLGRLNFEDERRWWWDEELDALRIEYEAQDFSAALAVAYELAPSRSDASFIEPSRKDVLRLIGELSWDWREDHALELFLLYEDDYSPQERSGKLVKAGREDETDGRFGWLGVRSTGVFALGRQGYLGYWVDTGFAYGDERLVAFEPDGSGSVAAETSQANVYGWGVDTGVSWILPLPAEPRLFGGYAHGSGDSSPGPDSDRSYRQSGLQTNEAGFGGVQRFSHYGVLLEPELSNLGIVTAGAGLSLLRSSSLDVVYHHYRQAEPAPELRGIGFETELTGTSREVGDEIDLVLAIEEWTRLELELVGAAFRAGRAFGDEDGTWSGGGFVALRYSF